MVKLEVGLHHGCPNSDHRSPGVVKLEVGFHHGCRDSDHRSSEVVKLVMKLLHGNPRMVKLEVGVHQGCYIREHEVFRGDEANDGASSPKMQEGEVHNGISPWEFQRA